MLCRLSLAHGLRALGLCGGGVVLFLRLPSEQESRCDVWEVGNACVRVRHAIAGRANEGVECQ